MQIFVKLYSNSKTIVLDVLPEYKIVYIKEMLYDRTVIPTYLQKLIYKNMILDDNKTVADYKITSDTTIYQNYSMRNIQ
jgi:hypothetical protein